MTKVGIGVNVPRTLKPGEARRFKLRIYFIQGGPEELRRRHAAEKQ